MTVCGRVLGTLSDKAAAFVGRSYFVCLRASDHVGRCCAAGDKR